MEDNKLKNKNIETYAQDMVKAIESDKGGLIKKIIHEEEEEEILKNLSPKSKENRLFMFISIILTSLAFTVFIFLMFFNDKINTVPIAPQAISMIFMDQTDFTPIDALTKEKIAETIYNQVNNTRVKIGGINGIYLTENKKVIGFKNFAAFMKSSLTSDQMELISDNFLLGALNGETKDLFILLKVKSFSDIFPVMQNWENKMLYDLHGFFGVKLSPETNYLFTKNFENGIVDNKNARILKDNDGKIVLMYVFADDNSIILTNSEVATNEVILRLNSSKIKK